MRIKSLLPLSIVLILSSCGQTLRGEDMYQKIKAKGILIRQFSTAGIENFIRISIGDAQQMEKLCSAIEKILS